MSGRNQNQPDTDSEGLPPSVRWYRYEGKDHFSRILALERERLLNSIRNSRETTNMEPDIETTEYITFSIDPVTFQRDFIDTDPIALFSIRTTFNPATELLFIKMITHDHTRLCFAVHEAIMDALQSMGLKRAIDQYAAVDLEVNGRIKQPDMGWGPIRPPRGYEKRPSVVLEVGVSESETKLRRDADLWLDPNKGNANVVISIKLNRKKAQVKIDKWVWDGANGTSVQSQHIEVSENDLDGIKLSGGPLTIPFNLLMLREPEAPRETDIIIDKEELHYIAERGWDTFQ
ncbi:hypothetical protein ACN38_g8572 [Penicillium nordicum]|uniref:Restriction endonuclease domain-containing protein n=1 Tax=Penicillium nordicum TaxID=229535 RepID=A0A0N0RY90_9EURO|nr:hypothetical protein ACN38_g8572 [Penicillium nordicum]